MGRIRPPKRLVVERSRDNPKRRLSSSIPRDAERDELCNAVQYGPYSKHKYNPIAYGLKPYGGPDVERTYCDEHAKFAHADSSRIPRLLRRGLHLGLQSERAAGDVPAMIWTIDDNGWIYELRITNAGQAEYHGYPILQNDAFARQILARARTVAFAQGGPTISGDKNFRAAIEAAEAFYR